MFLVCIAQELLLTTTSDAGATGFSFEAVFPAVIGWSAAFGCDGRNTAIQLIVLRFPLFLFARLATYGADEKHSEESEEGDFFDVHKLRDRLPP